MAERDDASEGAAPEGWAALARWPFQLAEELLLAPWTVRRARVALEELPALIDTLSRRLEETTGMLAAAMPGVENRLGGVAATAENLDVAVTRLADDLAGFREALDRMLPELSHLVMGMDDRFGRVEATVGELGEALLNVMGAIPGVRRALREGRSEGAARH